MSNSQLCLYFDALPVSLPVQRWHELQADTCGPIPPSYPMMNAFVDVVPLTHKKYDDRMDILAIDMCIDALSRNELGPVDSPPGADYPCGACPHCVISIL